MSQKPEPSWRKKLRSNAAKEKLFGLFVIVSAPFLIIIGMVWLLWEIFKEIGKQLKLW